MCSCYRRRSDKQRIAEIFHLNKLAEDVVLLPRDHDIVPKTHQPIIRQNRDTGDRELALLRWSLVPWYTKDLNTLKAFSTINAEAEGILTARTWSHPIKKRRCLVPADGFYKWLRPDRKTKIPFIFTMNCQEPFAFAGVWDEWKEPNGNWLQTFAIITTEANVLTAPIHNRMPVILHPGDYNRWLDHEQTESPPLDLLRPYRAEEMTVAQALESTSPSLESFGLGR
jgi:putative SOS response-associated peptidase YedK